MVRRAGILVGPAGQALDQMFQENISELEWQQYFGIKKHHFKDVKEFVDENLPLQLFDTIPERRHQTFPGYQAKRRIQNVFNFKARLMKYSKKLDVARDVIPHNE